MVIPNTVEITRKRNKVIEEVLDKKHYKSVGGRKNVNELESYQDIVIGTVVFNITGFPRSRYENFRSIATIENGELLQSKLEKFAILKYRKEDEEVTVTLNNNIKPTEKSCMRLAFLMYT